jgi:hypothetical protein
MKDVNLSPIHVKYDGIGTNSFLPCKQAAYLRGQSEHLA